MALGLLIRSSFSIKPTLTNLITIRHHGLKLPLYPKGGGGGGGGKRTACLLSTRKLKWQGHLEERNTAQNSTGGEENCTHKIKKSVGKKERMEGHEN